MDSFSRPVPPTPPVIAPQKRKFRWWLPFVILGWMFFAFGAFMILGIIILASSIEDQKPTIPRNAVLTINFNEVKEQRIDNPFAFLSGERTNSVSLLKATEAIKRAMTDDRIKGIYLKPRGGMLGSAASHELIEAVREFKTSGKFIYAFIETGAKRDYFNALPADSIFMPREGLLELTHYGASALFFRNMFDKLGIQWHVQQFEEYKGAAENLNNT
jgi:protease-4